jgi:Mannosylglycerate hydrolase MGH1-like glycoside hydrolase domain
MSALVSCFRLRLGAGLTLALLLVLSPEAFSSASGQAVSQTAEFERAAIHESLRDRLEQLNRNIATRGLLTYSGAPGKLLTGYSYGEFFDWDLYFENVYLSYYGVSTYDFTNLQVFLSRQKPDGFISRTLGVKYPRPHQMFKPFLAQLAVLGSEQTGSYEWLRGEDYAHLQKYLIRWFAYDTDHNGLPVWNSSDASGMDNQISRSGALNSYSDEGVDLACYLYRELEAMAVIAGKLGKAQDQAMYRAHARRLKRLINSVFWDNKDGFYYDRNQKTGRRIRVKSVAGFFPLWAGVATPKQANRLVHEHLMNAKEFWTRYPVPTYALTEPDFYEGTRHGECNWRGNTWIPSNFMIFLGLMRYGYLKQARELADRTYQMALHLNSATREYYDSKTGQGYGLNPFWGWSSLAYVMPLEYRLRYDPTGLTGPIRPIITDTLGIHFPRVSGNSVASR